MAEDFLARENELLGGAFSLSSGTVPATTTDDVDLDRAASAFPDIDIDGDVPLSQVPPRTIPNNSGFGFNLADLPSPPKQTATPSFAPKPQPSAGLSTPILQVLAEDEEEPEVIKKWRREQEESIRKRDEASAQKRKKTIAKAERAIDEFYEEYNAKKARNIKENKETEAAYLASLSESLSAGTTWSRICDLIELQNSQSKTLARTGPGTTDLARYREVLLRLRREGSTAPGAGGY